MIAEIQIQNMKNTKTEPQKLNKVQTKEQINVPTKSKVSKQSKGKNVECWIF